MNYQPIVKPAADRMPVRPNLIDYATARASFRWDAIRAELDGLPGGGLNIAHECIDRHLKTHRRDKTAMLWEGKDGRAETYTFAQMATASNKAANALRSLGVQKGDRVFVFLERVPELYFAVFGTLKLGAVIGPLFSAFGPDAVRDRPHGPGGLCDHAPPPRHDRQAEGRRPRPHGCHGPLRHRQGRPGPAR